MTLAMRPAASAARGGRSVATHLKAPPAATVYHERPPDTCVGSLEGVVVLLMPSWPYALFPQHHRLLSVWMPQVKPEPTFRGPS